MAFADQAALAVDEGFQQRVRIAIVTAATQIMGEAKTSDDVTYGKRQALAYSVLYDSGQHVERFAWAVASNPAVTAESVDGDVQFTVNACWDDIAGVTGSD